jgi:endogenous inhibitor of DNA gyrase (YacG/DUF329 family)
MVCVFCRRRPADPQWRPFCSERCRVQDLARWADGTYRIPAEPADASDEEGREAGRDGDRTPREPER